MDEEKRKQIFELLDHGCTRQEIVDRVGISRTTLGRFLLKEGRQQKKRLTDEEKEEILQLDREKQCSRREIAKRLQINLATVYSILRAANQVKHDSDARKPVVSDEQRKLILQLFEQGCQRTDIMREAKVGDMRVDIVVRQSGRSFARRDNLPLTLKQKNEALHLFDEGHSSTDIMRQFNLTYYQYTTLLEQYGKTRDPNHYKHNYLRETVLKLREEGCTYTMLRKRTNSSTWVIQKILNDAAQEVDTHQNQRQTVYGKSSPSGNKKRAIREESLTESTDFSAIEATAFSAQESYNDVSVDRSHPTMDSSNREIVLTLVFDHVLTDFAGQGRFSLELLKKLNNVRMRKDLILGVHPHGINIADVKGFALKELQMADSLVEMIVVLRTNVLLDTDCISDLIDRGDLKKVGTCCSLDYIFLPAEISLPSAIDKQNFFSYLMELAEAGGHSRSPECSPIVDIPSGISISDSSAVEPQPPVRKLPRLAKEFLFAEEFEHLSYREATVDCGALEFAEYAVCLQKDTKFLVKNDWELKGRQLSPYFPSMDQSFRDKGEPEYVEAVAANPALITTLLESIENGQAYDRNKEVPKKPVRNKVPKFRRNPINPRLLDYEQPASAKLKNYRCIVPFCKNTARNTAYTKVRFIMLPRTNPAARRGYMDVIGVPYTAARNIFICSKHFPPEEVDLKAKYVVKTGTLPSLFLTQEEFDKEAADREADGAPENDVEEITTFMDEQPPSAWHTRKNFRCIVPSCHNRVRSVDWSKIRFSEIPMKGPKRRKYLEDCGLLDKLPQETLDRRHMLICTKHFEPKQIDFFRKPHVKAGEVPTLFLDSSGENGDDEYVLAKFC
ncbi:uncharacterized protein LOC129599967 [Paramacrobiotus metropolitanus]|uniref:uncharacterized protein LOC129599967 n=1 Tax=Paramacrobiotus metropolitanus TaxID=2943436 RepID=UPI00244583DB|nr:uncharacterized protein LOC129599967 [Paramacrobiotus metropolitanus]